MTAATTLAPASASQAPGHPHRPPKVLVVFALLIAVPLLTPLVTLAWQAVQGGPWNGVLPPGRLLELGLNTLLLAAAVVVSSLGIGLLTAWLTSRTDVPGRRW